MKTLGVDLGTSNVSAAIAGKAVEMLDETGSTKLLPSVAAFLPTGVTQVGVSARRRRAIDPQNTIVSSKRLIGRRWHSRERQEFQHHYPLTLTPSKDGQVAFKTRRGVMSPSEVATKLLKTLCHRAEIQAENYSAVVCIPVEFQTEQIQATIEAARAVGFAGVTTLPEPVATALAHAKAGHIAELGRTVIYDLGGGTFDLAVVESSADSYKVLGRGGDQYLGGDDIDRALADWAAAEVVQHFGWNLRSDDEVFDRLTLECERAKITLCHARQAQIELGQVDPAAPQSSEGVTIDRVTLIRICTELVRRTFYVVDDVMRQAGVNAEDLDAVLLAGGTTQLPMVQFAIEQYFGQKPLCLFNPLEVVAIGASLVEL